MRRFALPLLLLLVLPVFAQTPKAITASSIPGSVWGAEFAYTGTIPASSVLWDFGDGMRDFGMKVPHHFKSPGDYQVTAMARGRDNKTRNFTMHVVVTAPLDFKESADPTQGWK